MHRYGRTIVIIDFDWSFQFWLAGILTEAGHRVFPARCAADAASLIRSAHVAPSLLVVDPGLPGIAKLIAAMKKRDGRLRVIASGEPPADTDFPQLDGVFPKPANITERESVAALWRAAIELLLA